MFERIGKPSRFTLVAMIPIVLAATGCQRYTPLSFNPAEILEDVKAEQAEPIPGENLTFAKAAELMSSRNAELKELRAEYQTLKVVADIPTPLSNPEIEVGAGIGHRMGITPESKIQPLAALGFAIPLGPRLRRESDLNDVKAETAKLAVVARHRDLFLSLRAAFVNHALAAQRLEQRQALSEVIREGEATSERLFEAGQIGELELNQGKILNRLEGLKRVNDELEAQTAAATLADLLGVSPGKILSHQVIPLPEPPATLDPVDVLEKKLVENNTTLSGLRMGFWEADAALKLELSKQYPDLNLGLGFEQEPGEKAQVFELGIGLELPLFDRNQQGIAQALAARKAARTAYKAELSRLLSRLEVGVRKHTLLYERTRAMGELLPLAQKNLRDAHKLANLGAFNFMRYLSVSREYAELAMEHVEQKSQLWAALAELEQLVGCPMVPFPDDAARTMPADETSDTTNKEPTP